MSVIYGYKLIFLLFDNGFGSLRPLMGYDKLTLSVTHRLLVYR